MKITRHSYTEATVKQYQMTMGEIQHSIAQAMIAKDYKENKVRIVHVTYGEVDEYEGLDNLLMHDFNSRYELICYGASLIHFNDTNEDIIVVRIAEIDD